MKHGGGDARIAVKHLKVPVMVKPTDPALNATATAIKLWEMKVTVVSKRVSTLEENVQTIYVITIGQCTNIMA